MQGSPPVSKKVDLIDISCRLSNIQAIGTDAFNLYYRCSMETTASAGLENGLLVGPATAS
jgi:hypothetical protein